MEKTKSHKDLLLALLAYYQIPPRTVQKYANLE